MVLRMILVHRVHDHDPRGDNAAQRESCDRYWWCPWHGRGRSASVRSGRGKVVVADILEHEVEMVAADIRASGEEAVAAKIDVTSESEWVGLIAKAVATY